MNSAFDVYDAIALTLHANNNQLSNRTTLQKLIYFSTLKLKLESIPYSNHFYGPFSPAVASASDEMVAFSYLNESISSRYNYESYHYALTDPGKKYAGYAEKMFPEEYQTISGIVTTCNKSCGLQATPLSYSAKAHYVLVHGGKDRYTINDVQEAAKQFDWDISAADANTGMHLLENLDLVHSS